MEEMQEVIKIPKSDEQKAQIWRQVMTIASIIVFGILCFCLGRLSRIEENKIPLTVSNENEGQASGKSGGLPFVKSNGGVVKGDSSKAEIVASKNGKKYYLSTCASVKRINPANIIKFVSASAAIAAGYTPAANCPGL